MNIPGIATSDASADSSMFARNEPETEEVAALSQLDPEHACARLESSLAGLTFAEAAWRLANHGPNLIARERKPTIIEELGGRAQNPLNALLLTLAVVSYLLGDIRAAIVIAVMVVLAITTAFIQEHRSNEAAARLRALVTNKASVKRQESGDGHFHEVPIESLVPGDIVQLSAGDMIPADIRLLETKDLFINQSALTGEAMPAEKNAQHCVDSHDSPFDIPNMCCMGANVVSGYATGVVVRTGGETFFGQLADEIAGRRIRTAFDRGVDRFTWLMMRFIIVMVPTVLQNRQCAHTQAAQAQSFLLHDLT